MGQKKASKQLDIQFPQLSENICAKNTLKEWLGFESILGPSSFQKEESSYMFFKSPFFKDSIWYLWCLSSGLSVPLEQHGASDGADTGSAKEHD